MSVNPLEPFYSLFTLNPEMGAVKRLLPNQFNPGALAEICRHSRASLILYSNINRYNLAERFNPDTIAELKMRYLNTVASNLRVIRIFFDVADLLTKGGIRVVPLKGVSMSLDTYLDEGLRPMTDLDILIDKGDMIKAIEILRGGRISRG